MNRGNLIIAGAIAAVVLTAALLFGLDHEQQTEEVTQQSGSTTSSPLPTNTAAATAPLNPSARAPGKSAVAANEDLAAQFAGNEQDGSDITFETDVKERIVVNEDARLNLERLFALFGPQERQKKLDELSATLPPIAARELNDLMERFASYEVAKAQTFPPGQDFQPADRLNLIEGLHTLRVQYFGAEVAEAFFGKEEATTRQLLRLMDIEEDPSMTLEEKAERAQALYQQSQMNTDAAGRKAE